MVDVFLAQAIRAAGIPIHGVSIGRVEDKATWRVDFLPEVTPAQRTQADGIVSAFTPPTQQDMTDATALQETNQKELQAVAVGLWECIPAPTMTKAQLKARILTIYKSL